MKQLFIAWVRFQRRIESMEAYFKYESIYISVSLKNRFLKPVEYLVKCQKTLAMLWKSDPEVVWIQLPPSPLLYLIRIYKLFVNPKLRIVADCHNATFRKPWLSSPLVISLLNQCEVVIVHNDEVRKAAIVLGIYPERVVVLRDRVMQTSSEDLPSFLDKPRPWILFPCSFGTDEPISQVLEAARQAPNLTFIITGNVERAKGKHDLSSVPENVVFTGFLSKSRYDSLLCNTDLVLGLTKLDGIQLSVAGEAVGVGKPMVLADTKLLRTLFYQGAIYTDPLNPQSIAQSCYLALEKRFQLELEILEMRKDTDRNWLESADHVKRFIESL
ncbi:hypothetical protein [Thermoleptolyngbya sp.]